MIYGDKTPPSTENMEFLRSAEGNLTTPNTFYSEINVLDVDRAVQEGYFIPSPIWYDEVAGSLQRYSAERSWFAPVEVIRDAQGKPIQVIVSFEIWDEAGNIATVKRTLTVTTTAARR
jgi:hypothetical protein